MQTTWSKQWLLPLPHDVVRQLSLTSHLALVNCSRKEGNRHLFHELTRVTYLSFLMWDAGYGCAHLDLFESAEALLGESALQGEATGTWSLGDSAIEMIKRLLIVHDEQIGAVPSRVFAEATVSLERLIQGGQTDSPIAAAKARGLRRTGVSNASLAYALPSVVSGLARWYVE
ncbi:hypothetical protein [Burkholderia multivorans]|uniref:hypothetical protein n=1 Tax=Burkholderia multivorans TaxID=87883 RepID=UPI002ED264DE|nr:hypothetical protein V1241_27415 [Burkholderia multivorans]